MPLRSRPILLFLLAALFLLTASLLPLIKKQSPITSSSLLNLPLLKPKYIENYSPPSLENKQAYTLIFIGDSMTEALGPHFDQMGPLLKNYFPDKIFGLFNYGFGSTNILSVEQRLTQNTDYLGTIFPAILDRQVDILFLESFGHNPLSQYPLEEGLKKQRHALDEIVLKLVRAKPETLIVFFTTVAPSKTHYALSSRDLSPENRQQWAQERIAYIQNHATYAQNHNLPLIDIYSKSLDNLGQADLQYINHDDYIHPSTAGLQLISREIADYLFQNNIIPR